MVLALAYPGCLAGVGIRGGPGASLLAGGCVPAQGRPHWSGAALVLLLACTAALPALADGLLYDPVFRPGKSTAVLVKGAPALTRADVNDFIDLFEAAFDLALPQADEQHLRDQIEIDFTGRPPEQRRTFLDTLRTLGDVRTRLRSGNTDAAEDTLRAFRRHIDEAISANPTHAVYRALAEILKRRHATHWRGDPPVKALAADLYLELAAFVTSLGRGTEIQPTEGQRSVVRDELLNVIARTPRETRVQLARIHVYWLRVKAAWDAADEAQRFQLRFEAVRFLAKLLPKDKQIEINAGPTLRDYAREAARIAERSPALTAFTNATRNPALLLKTLNKGLALDEAASRSSLLFRQ